MERNESLASFQGIGLGSDGTRTQMRKDLDSLIATCPDYKKEKFVTEMDNFYSLFTRYLDEKSSQESLDWEKIKSPAESEVVGFNTLPQVADDDDSGLLDKLCVVKLNGGLGTTMGCVGPKSAIEVKSGMTFLDLTVRQIEYLNSTSNAEVPLILMNSFNTDHETSRIIQKYDGNKVDILTFNQSRYPRFFKDSFKPLPQSFDSPSPCWFPPGHGDFYHSFYNSGLVDQLLAQGKEYVFVSNIDNLGATVDTKILQHMVETESEFLMEVTDKTRSDIKGGTLINYNEKIRLLEIAQVPGERVDDFKSVSKFKIFNTNNLWISLKGIKRVVENSELKMEIIENPKRTSDGEKIIQLETAVGAAIKHFKNAHGVNVPRSRFLPVKGTSDLLLVQSDLFNLKHGELVMSEKRQFKSVPLVKLGEEFKKVAGYYGRFKTIPNILELDHLTVTGDVVFGSGVSLKGTVIIVANHGSHIDIPSGSLLENKIVSGNLRILDH